MRLVYITGVAPFGPHEAFFIPEMMEFLHQGHDVLVVPRSVPGPPVYPDGRELAEKHSAACGVFSCRIAAGALAEIICRPRRALRALGLILRSRSGVALATNLAVYPKGLWVGGLAPLGRGAHSRPLDFHQRHDRPDGQ